MSTNTPQHNKQKLEAMLRSEDITVATGALLYLCFNIDDPEWIQVKCIEVSRDIATTTSEGWP